MKNAIVWGAAGGIGKALTQKLVDENFTVVAVARRSTAIGHITPYIIHADVAQPSEVTTAAHAASQIASAFDLFVYAVGDIASLKIGDMALGDWERILSANLTGAFLTAQASLPLLSPQAQLIFIGAVHERLRLPGFGAYAAAKAGLEAFVAVLGKEARRKTLIVRPGAVNTPLWSKVPFALPKNALQPEALAEAIYAAILEGKEGLLDL